jgi:hypothetical protein
MSVLVYSFPDDHAASSAAAQLAGDLSLGSGAVALGTHGQMGGIHDGLPLLAAVVDLDSIDAARAIIEDAGGALVEMW